MASSEVGLSDSDESIVRPAILVHSAAEGLPMEFQSGDGPIVFSEERLHRVVKNHNALIDKLMRDYGGESAMPIGAYPPILDQHESDSNDRIVGRLNHKLWFERRDVPGVGKNVGCVMTKITFLGKEAVGRVRDGRIFHLSIGINEKSDTLGETSTVIKPAAAGAMVLSRLQKGEKKMSDVSRLQASKDRLAKLGAIKGELTTLVAKAGTSSETIKLAKKQNEITHRLTGLMRSKKLTPAEFKSMDVKRLSKLDSESLNTVLSTFEIRQDVILTGQRGSTDALETHELTANLEKEQMKRLKAETMGDLRKLSGKKLKDGDEPADKKSMSFNDKVESGKDDKELDKPAPKAEGADKGLEKGGKGGKLAEMKKHLDAGDMESAKGLCDKMMSEGGEDNADSEMNFSEGIKSEDAQTNMDAVQGQVDELNTQMARLAGMVSQLMESEQAEQAEMAVGEPTEPVPPRAEGGEGEAKPEAGKELGAGEPKPEPKDDPKAMAAGEPKPEPKEPDDKQMSEEIKSAKKKV